ncbi:MAG: hypothetical protein EXQ58_00465 [Acidobacteria bacterium]|nr:hypothetical protein [Acidobacteriota bacterium]
MAQHYHMLEVAGQACGVSSAIFVPGLTAIFFWLKPYSRGALAGSSMVMGLVALLTLVAGASAPAKRPGLVRFSFVFSLVPVGTFLVGTPGVFRWIGGAHLGYLAAAVCLVSGPVPCRSAVVMDPYTRRIIGFGVQAGTVNGVALCRMLNRALLGYRAMPKYLSSDPDPLYSLSNGQSMLGCWT